MAGTPAGNRRAVPRLSVPPLCAATSPPAAHSSGPTRPAAWLPARNAGRRRGGAVGEQGAGISEMAGRIEGPPVHRLAGLYHRAADDSERLPVAVPFVILSDYNREECFCKKYEAGLAEIDLKCTIENSLYLSI